MCCTCSTMKNIENYYICLNNAIIFITESNDSRKSEGCVLTINTYMHVETHVDTYFTKKHLPFRYVRVHYALNTTTCFIVL